MCKHGMTVTCRVLVPARLSYDGKDRWANKPIDACLAGLIDALNAGGMFTAACCCGHGTMPGKIVLHDGRILTITKEEDDDTR